MKEFKRLTTGLLSSLMVLSLILMPIPQTNIAWAEDDTTTEDCTEDASVDDQGVYKPGCEFLNTTLSQATLDNPAMYTESGILKLIEQYIVGLFGLMMINGLRWNYLYKYNPAVYGNDCPGNWGPKITMRIVQVAALTYVIGDAQANVKFKQAAKIATDEAFAAKGKNYIPDKDSEEVQEALEAGEEDPRIAAIMENNSQIQAYTTLIDVMSAQLSAIKTKKNMTRVANLGYYAATGAELGNILACNAKCSAQIAERKTNEGLFIGKLANAVTAAALGMSNGNAACGVLHGNLMMLKGLYTKDKVVMKAFLAEHKIKTVAESAKSASFIERVLSSIGNWFMPTFSKAQVAAKAAKEMGKEAGEEGAEQGTDAALRAKEKAKISAYLSKTATFAAQMIATGEACKTPHPSLEGTAIGIAKNVVYKYIDFLFGRTTCCGGPGHTKDIWEVMDKTFQSTQATNPYFIGYWNARKTALMAEASISPNPDAALYTGIGSLNIQGIPLKSTMASKKDIISFGLFEKVTDVNSPEFKRVVKDRSKFMKSIFRSGIESFLLSTYSDKLMQSPKKYIKVVAENNKKVDKIMEMFEQDVLDEMNVQINRGKLATVSGKMRSFAKKVSNLIMPKAHAIGGVGMMAGSMILSMVASQVENPWIKEIFNMGGKLMMLQGLLGKVMKDHGLVRPLSRNIIWGLMGGISELMIAHYKNTIKKVKRNLEVVRTEKERYENSAIARTNVEREKRDGDSQLDLQDYDPTASKSNKMKIKACATPKADGGFAPSMCPAVISKQKFSLPEISGGMKNHLSPDFLKGMSMLSNYAHGAATGSLDGENMSESDLDAIRKVSAAMSKKNNELRKKVDEHNESLDLKNGVKAPSLRRINSAFKQHFGKGSSGGGLAALPDAGGSEYNSGPRGVIEKKNIINNGQKKKSASSGGGPKQGAGADFDLDFGDDSLGAVSNSDSTQAGASKKNAEKLDEFVLKHDDINKRKNVPIWKILSNRYILSYPRILDEQDLKPDESDKKQAQ